MKRHSSVKMFLAYVVCGWIIGVCYGFVLISSADSKLDSKLFQLGEGQIYQLHSAVLLNENDTNAKSVGFFLRAEVWVSCVWAHNDAKILKLELKRPQLHIRSRKAPSPDGYSPHSSELDTYPLEPSYLSWKNDQIYSILLSKEEPLALHNFKKGVASLFQFKMVDDETTEEVDAGGRCKVQYHAKDKYQFQKIKTRCASSDLPRRSQEDPILGVSLSSTSITRYELDSSLSHLNAIQQVETHELTSRIGPNLSSSIASSQTLSYDKSFKSELLQGETVEEVKNNLRETYIEESIETKKEVLPTEKKTFQAAINEWRDGLSPKIIGSLSSAKAFLHVIPSAREASKDEIVKTLGVKKNQKILAQIYDILGIVQTDASHSAVMKKLFFEKDDHLDLSERYLWSISLAPYPNPAIAKDLLDRYRKNVNYPEKIKETLVLTLAALAHALPKERKLAKNVEEIIVNGLNAAVNDERCIFIRGLRNLRSSSTVEVLAEVVRTGTPKEVVLAFKALKALPLDKKIEKLATRSFLELDKQYDSSARTLAIDILLQTGPSEAILSEFLSFLKRNDSSYEVTKYLVQTLVLKSQEDLEFRERLEQIVRKDPSLNNYHVLAPRGLSTALKRSFMTNSPTKGSIRTIQEILGGIVKRGVADVILERDTFTKQLFSLGIFSGGLGSFMGGDSQVDEGSPTAGIELTVLDRQVRPFVFFNGQGELMGHVWSGTASERTPAFQTLALLQDHEEYVRLGNGFIADIELKTAVSYDLSGKIEISIWGRTADALVEKSVSVLTSGIMKIDNSIVKSQIEFSGSLEPKLSMKFDIDFSGKLLFCMRVTQPDCIFRHNIFKIERIPGSKHKLRISKYKKTVAPGLTYSLNRKNNDMCSALLD